MAFFLSDTTTGGTTSDGTTTTSATAAGDAVTPHSSTVTAIYVSGVAELTVELRPADEGEPATMFVCSAEDSDITGSSVDDVVVLSNLTVGVTYTVRCKACNDVGDSTLSATSDPIVASTLADPPYITEVVVTGDVELTVSWARLGMEGQL